MEKFDVVVIGAGPGGYPAAIRAAQLGARVALVEKEQLGGTCLNWGCIPTKALIACSELYWHAKHGTDRGVISTGLSADYAAMMKRKDGVVEKLRSGVKQLLLANGVAVFEGTGAFASRNQIVVTKGNEKTSLETTATIIASGSTSAVPGFIPRHERILESRGFLGISHLPSSLMVLGGGVIGCEFACMAAQLGVKVTVVEMLEDILFMLDADVRREIRRRMEQELNIRILTGKAMENIQATSKHVTARCGEESLTADLLLVSVGRRPVTQELNLSAAGISVNERGFIPVNGFMRTSVATVYAIGDVTAGSTQLAHAATAQGICAAENAVRNRRVEAETLVPACIFTSPEAGSVGLTEQVAKQKSLPVTIGKFPFAALGKAMTLGDTAGFVKWLADEKTGRLLGAHAVGPHATELIAEAAVAIRAELTVEELGRTIHCHPTLSESWMEAAHAVHGECIHAAPKRKK